MTTDQSETSIHTFSLLLLFSCLNILLSYLRHLTVMRLWRTGWGQLVKLLFLVSTANLLTVVRYVPTFHLSVANELINLLH